MRGRHLFAAIISFGVLAFSHPGYAASSCPGGGSPTNCKAHCTITNPPQCTETCDCAITKATGTRATALIRRNGKPIHIYRPVTRMNATTHFETPHTNTRANRSSHGGRH